MPFIDIVNNRFSCRKFKEIPVEREKLALCLEAARLAPSACNSQPWKFMIIDDPTLKAKALDSACRGAFANSSFAKQAPVLVIVITEKGNFTSRIGNMVRDTKLYLIDIGIAVEHFVLQATELGLGTCFMGWFDEGALKKALNLPKSVKIDLILPVGYPDQENRTKVRKKTEEIATFK